MLHAPQSPAAFRLPARISLPIVCFPFDSAVRKLLVQRQQAAHRLRVGEHHGLPLSLELGFWKLPVTAAVAAVAQSAVVAAVATTVPATAGYR